MESRLILEWVCLRCGIKLDEVRFYKTRKFCYDCVEKKRIEHNRRMNKLRLKKSVTGYDLMISLFKSNPDRTISEIVCFCGYVSDDVCHSMICYARKDGHSFTFNHKEKLYHYGGKK